jgi:hypothetical protein
MNNNKNMNTNAYDWRFQIGSKTKEQHFNLIRCLFAIGYTSSNEQIANDYIREYGFQYPWTVINPFAKKFSGNLEERDRSITITFNELLEFDSTLVIKVKLNDSYTADVSKEGIQVGCQTFPLSIIQELSAAFIKIENSVNNL